MILRSPRGLVGRTIGLVLGRWRRGLPLYGWLPLVGTPVAGFASCATGTRSLSLSCGLSNGGTREPADVGTASSVELEGRARRGVACLDRRCRFGADGVGIGRATRQGDDLSCHRVGVQPVRPDHDQSERRPRRPRAQPRRSSVAVRTSSHPDRMTLTVATGTSRAKPSLATAASPSRPTSCRPHDRSSGWHRFSPSCCGRWRSRGHSRCRCRCRSPHRCHSRCRCRRRRLRRPRAGR